ncbi:hypothetical protein QAD02_018133 [Eretmocerus hayati]|uniref:Uncharacterized protein n=1 Tax=Eretmocerus hayati TaxID=131215 RepID=A0ACC2PFT6_9HYME|nr:hypothetical protein QAD02_018133 [Eretmocerus hayati]
MPVVTVDQVRVRMRIALRIRENPCLYNKSDQGNLNKRMKARVCREIAREVNILEGVVPGDPNFLTGHQVLILWNKMRTKYCGLQVQLRRDPSILEYHFQRFHNYTSWILRDLNFLVNFIQNRQGLRNKSYRNRAAREIRRRAHHDAA